jgi:hypothetical protein
MTNSAPDRGSPPRMPVWVKTSLIVVGVLLLLVAVMLFTGLGGEHGPGRHLPAGSGVSEQRGGA